MKKEQVLSLLNVRDYYSQYVKEASSGKEEITVCSPLRKDKHPSFSVNLETGLWFDHATSDKGDVFAFEQQRSNCDFKTALSNLAQFCGIDDSGGDSNTQKTSSHAKEAITIAHVNGWAEALFSNVGDGARAYLKARGLNVETLHKLKVGYDERKCALTIPLARHGDTITALKRFHFRDNVPLLKDGKKVVTTHGSTVLFCSGLITHSDHVIVSEGEWDCLLLRQNGFDAVTGTGGAGTWKETWTEAFRNKNVVVCYDSDSAGRSGAEKVVDVLVSAAKSVKNLNLFGSDGTAEMKDVTDYFVKAGKTAQDFEKLIEDAEVCCPTIGGVSRELYYALTSDSARVKVNAAQDFVRGVFYYAVRVQDKMYLVTSEKKLIEFEKASDSGIELSNSDVDWCRFSSFGILGFLGKQSEVNPSQLFDEIKNHISRFVFLKDPDILSLLALWTMGTYVFRVFRYYPYIHLNGAKQSGKTLLMEVLAPLCFNGQLSVNSTEAVLFRDVQNNALTLFLDEVEKLRDSDKEKYGAVMNVLNTGFSRSGLVKRCGGRDKDKIQSFSTYSPKMLAGINDLDDVLGDRTICIRMVRRLDTELGEHYIENQEMIDSHGRVRDMLYRFGLEYGKDLAKIYSEHLGEIPGLDHLSNRAFDLWMPMILLANTVDASRGDKLATITEEMIRLSKKSIGERLEEDGMDNETCKLLTVLNRMVQELEPAKPEGSLRYFGTKEAFEFFHEQDEFAWLENKGTLSRRLKKVEVGIKNMTVESKTRRFYVVDLSKLQDYCQRYLSSQDESVTVTEV